MDGARTPDACKFGLFTVPQNQRCFTRKELIPIPAQLVICGICCVVFFLLL